MKRHRGEYLYHCSICNKGFCSNSNLQGHMSWHTGVKEYRCGHCRKEFRYEKHLKQHLLSKHQ
ncbi:hypothetical protein LSH36_79g09032 [Paralvinella palmiformis]|uniref:C2H2-type domain-containing protein n=1 Tax=Paralvinella palmiformis TaxID=53620 RepID=A0AAD9K213_9ANNE|nr:hypothetical protein LSH36_79g09032 [Paralvinella palmiformis]